MCRCAAPDLTRAHCLVGKQDSGVLSWSLVPDADVVWFAYFAPYSLEQHNDLIAMAASSGVGARHCSLPLVDCTLCVSVLQAGSCCYSSCACCSAASNLPTLTVAQFLPPSSISFSNWASPGVPSSLLPASIFFPLASPPPPAQQKWSRLGAHSTGDRSISSQLAGDLSNAGSFIGSILVRCRAQGAGSGGSRCRV